MARYLSLLTVCTMFLFILGCTNSNTTSKNFTPAKTDIVSRNSGVIENETRLKEFIKNTETGQKDTIRVVAYTKEGDPILTDLTFNGKQLDVTRDNTRDEYGVGDIRTLTCEKIIVEGKKYSMTGCEGYEVPYFLAEGF
ncbi:DUF4362 domain-containing protein [Bacillus sp. JJ1122]|uniref:DUF4362 domain-containing protein n=1 Tax=Bacillus sp. JJ1122 TaxID=3122951 RepID=UPI002FFF5F94